MNMKTTNPHHKGSDIIELITHDHKELKRLIKILKDPDLNINDRRVAFKEFAPLFIVHSKPEEQSLYREIRQNKELRMEAIEGEIEHSIVEQLLTEAQNENDEDIWTAKVKVMAELIKHHIEEEETDVLPVFRKNTTESRRIELGNIFLQLKETVSLENPIFRRYAKHIEQTMH